MNFLVDRGIDFPICENLIYICDDCCDDDVSIVFLEVLTLDPTPLPNIGRHAHDTRFSISNVSRTVHVDLRE